MNFRSSSTTRSFVPFIACLTLGSAATLVATEQARADVIFNTFGPGDAVDTGGVNFPVSGGTEFVQAVRFVPGAASSVTQAQAYLHSTGGNGFSSLFVQIVTESGALPSSTVVWTSNPAIVSPAGNMATFTTASAGNLTAGQPYWLLIQGTTSTGNAASAWAGQPHSFGSRAQKTGPNGSWIRTDATDLPAVRIEGSSTGACCNPATGGCAVLQSSTCSTLGLRFDGVGAACSPDLCRSCPGDFNHSGAKTVQDLFDFLAAYFGAC